MFGADTALVFDALQMIAVTAAFTGGAVYLIMRRPRKAAQEVATTAIPAQRDDLEDRVHVLQRIATDPATRIAEEFEQLEKADREAKEPTQ